VRDHIQTYLKHKVITALKRGDLKTQI